MGKQEWKKLITESCKAAGTYMEWCDSVIDSLAEILMLRDEAGDQYKKLGGQPIVKYTNKGGNTNPTKNPTLVMWNDLNSSALAYWRELGLTPSSYKKMTGDAPKKEKVSGLAAALKEIEG